MSESELKIAVLLALLFLAVVFVALLVVMRALGSISYSLERLEDVIGKEVVLAHNRRIRELRSEQKQRDAASQRKRRQQALLNIPLLGGMGGDDDE